MAVAIAKQTFSHLPAGQDLSAAANQFRCVKIVAGKIMLCDTAGEYFDGILINGPKLDEAALVAFGGQVKVRFGATVADDAELATAADGEGATAASGHFIRGKVVEGGAAGEYGSVLLVPQGIKA